MAKRARTPKLCLDPKLSAQAAHLHYVHEGEGGYRRLRSGKGFRYVGANGRRANQTVMKRIRALVLPPAWREVWICGDAHGHLQATGIDARGRKQYRYHARWREVRDEAKYERVILFGQRLPQIRAAIEKDLSAPGIEQRKVLATVVKLLETTLIRVGNEEYSKENGSFGLTTMLDRHVTIEGSKVHFEFKGKSGVKHAIDLRDRRLAKIIGRCQDLPGQQLFQYVDDEGRRHRVGSSEVNQYLQEISGDNFTAKDFRTFAGTVLAAQALNEFEKFDSQTQAKKNVVQAVEQVAKRLGNTKAICRKCYVHPEVLSAYLDGSLIDTVQSKVEKELQHLTKLKPEEAAVLAFLETRLQQEKRATRAQAA